MTGGRALRIVVIAPARHPIRRPHAGGLESAVWTEVAALRRRGHDVAVVGVRGSDFVTPGSVFELPELHWPDEALRSDERYPPAYATTSLPALDRALDEIEASAGRYDVISNHCLDPLPVLRAPQLGAPMITTLHTPADPFVAQAAIRAAADGSRFIAVSEFTRLAWAAVGIEATVLPNAIDPAAWPSGPGGPGLVWFGRIVLEKAPHLAIEVARRLGRRLTIAGRIGDQRYAERRLFPMLGPEARFLGQLSPDRLAHLVGHSAAAVSTPDWAEPFGLVAPEALMCGTPCVSFAVGGVPEIAAGSTGMEVVEPGDTVAMAECVDAMIRRAEDDPTFRSSIRTGAVRRFSLAARIAALEDCFQDALADRPRVGELRA